MYKSRLQELCMKKFWALPTYTTTRDGPDHNPRFRASVTVNGDQFETKDLCRSSKEAQNEAAKIAFVNLSLPTLQQSSMISGAIELKSQNAVQNSIPSSIAMGPYLPQPDGLPSNMFKLANGQREATKSTKGSITESSTNIPNLDLLRENSFNPGEEMQSFKSQLQYVLRKRNLKPAIYSSVREGTSHAPRFKAAVTVNDEVFESLDFYRTLRDAENAAAKVAVLSLSNEGIQEVGTLREAENAAAKVAVLSLSNEGIQEDDDNCNYKNILQEMLHKEGCSLPTYETTRSGSSHNPAFTSTVEIEGEIFCGDVAKTKKRAEMNAAKIAFAALNERRPSRTTAGPSLVSKAQEALAQRASGSRSIITIDLSEKYGLRSLSGPTADRDDGDDSDEDDDGADINDDKAGIGKLNTEAMPRGEASSSSCTYASLRDPILINPLVTESSTSSPSPRHSDAGSIDSCGTLSSNHLGTAVNDGSPEGPHISKLCNRVQVFPRKPNMKVPEGATVLPISSDRWVAFAIDYQNQEGK